jgi:peptidoglycan/LPS O-acetylase OafA/YrhL
LRAKVQSFQDRLDAVGGFGPGFDLVRLMLCYEVMAWHAIALTTGNISLGLNSVFWLPFNLMVPMFFTLSGFLVTASALRLAPRDYLLNRAARILPALFAVTLFAMLVVGPLTTRLPLTDYFAGADFLKYARNLVGIPYYLLPGVFENNVFPGAVNGSLWTVRWEIGCYAMMAIMVGCGVARRAWVVPVLALSFGAVFCLPWVAEVIKAPGLIGLVARQLFSAGAMLYPYFLGGAAIWMFRHRIPWHGGIAAACLALIVAGSVFLDGETWARNPVKSLILIGPSAYLVAWAGLQRLPVPRLYRGGDYSYGVYLWHFPVLQMIQHFLHLEQWWQLLLVGFLPVTLLSAASWHMIEGPVLAARRRAARAARA